MQGKPLENGRARVGGWRAAVEKAGGPRTPGAWRPEGK